jgi:SAM-dependent methyltransferase
MDLSEYKAKSAVGFGEIGSLLDLFSIATNWKSYFVRQVAPYVSGKVLEVGAGIGGTTRIFVNDCRFDSWTCLEPDAALCASLQRTIEARALPAACRAVHGSLDDLASDDLFDTILYVDVLEHIREDDEELRKAAAHLSEGGNLIVVSPSHNWLYATFDYAVGHYRRYTRKALRGIAPDSVRELKIIYLDSIGMFASLANKLLLKQTQPNGSQLVVWDRVLVPMSKLIDPLLGYNLGKQIIAVWQRPPGTRS